LAAYLTSLESIHSMSFVQSNSARIFWRAEGDASKPALLLSHSLGCDHLIWQPVMAALLTQFMVIRYDTRGHGASDAPVGDYSLAQLAQDALAVADAAGAKQFHFCGVSMGGMTGMELALTAQQRLLSLTLANTSAAIPREVFQARIETLRKGGLAAIVDVVMSRFFSAQYRQSTQSVAHINCASTRHTLLSTDLEGYIGCCAAIRDMQLEQRIAAIKTPTLVITGKLDESTPPAMGQAIAARMANASLIELNAAHISATEQPASFAKAVIAHALGASPVGSLTEAQRLANGRKRREQILGEDYVAQSLNKATDFNREWQQFITQYAWGSIWTRGVIDDQTRRLLVLVMTATGARWEEFRLHLRAALDAGLEVPVLQEALMQIAIYSGVPAANTAFHIAAELLGQRVENKTT
jgi:3-oxoadipate enol-lactonase / 4-carboxymuconolactone decarboxylase